MHFQLQTSELNEKHLSNTITTLENDAHRQNAENAKLQMSLNKLSEASRQLDESKAQLAAISLAKQAAEDEKAILQNACNKFEDIASFESWDKRSCTSDIRYHLRRCKKISVPKSRLWIK